MITGKRLIITLSLSLLFLNGLSAQTRVRHELAIPDILGYETLICDFHTHTVFSDGNVWPTVRPEEAWREGLDVIAITDHVEYLPHKDDINIGFNRSYEIAKPLGDALKITVLRGGEITRSMPPGHSNAIFLEDVAALKTENWEDAYAAAADQGAFIFWNHPGWKGQQKDGIPRWYDEHTMLAEKGWMHGMEVVNGWEYYPEAHAWCLEKGITMLANSDIHDPIHMDVNFHSHDDERNHRPVTLVFAKDNTPKSIKDALMDRRTALYAGNRLIGEERYLLPMFMQSVSFDERSIQLRGRQRVYLQVTNSSELDYELTLMESAENLEIPESITLYGESTVLFPVRATDKNITGSESYELQYRVENCLVKPNEGMPVNFKLKVRFYPAAP